MNEARIVETETGLKTEGEGWFVLNVADVSWNASPRGGAWTDWEAGDALFAQIGIGVHVLRPGEAPGYYHRESDQEGFLVLDGECVAIVEGEERRMRQWDYFHCPAGTNHIIVGSGDRPCALLMVGGRTPGKAIHYPVDEVAGRHGWSVGRATDSPKEAYANEPQPRWVPSRAVWPSSGGEPSRRGGSREP